MVDHFHQQVIAKKKLGGEARAMVVIHASEDGTLALLLTENDTGRVVDALRGDHSGPANASGFDATALLNALRERGAPPTWERTCDSN